MSAEYIHNHVCDLSFQIDSKNVNGSDVTPAELRLAIQTRILTLSDDELAEAVGLGMKSTSVNFDDAERYSVIALCTSHLTEDDACVLEKLAVDADESMILSRKTGFFIKFYESLGSNLREFQSHALQNIIKRAHASGCRMIEFDCDAGEDSKLPTFDW